MFLDNLKKLTNENPDANSLLVIIRRIINAAEDLVQKFFGTPKKSYRSQFFPPYQTGNTIAQEAEKLRSFIDTIKIQNPIVESASTVSLGA